MRVDRLGKRLRWSSFARATLIGAPRPRGERQPAGADRGEIPAPPPRRPANAPSRRDRAANNVSRSQVAAPMSAEVGRWIGRPLGLRGGN